MKKNFSSLFVELAGYAFATMIITVGIVSTVAIAASDQQFPSQEIAFTISANQ